MTSSPMKLNPSGPAGRGMLSARTAGGAALPRRAARARVAAAPRAAKTKDGPSIAIAGVTGAVGQEFLKVLKERNFPYGKMKLLASKRSAGKKMDFNGDTYTVEEMTDKSFGDVDIALFSAGSGATKKFAEAAINSKCIIVDNSSAFRMTEGVPLVIPEVNPDALDGTEVGQGGIIANPNCSTIIALMGVTPLHRKAGVERMVVSTYQAASGAGQEAMDELWLQTREVLDGKEVTKNIFPCQYAFNLFSHNSPLEDTGYNEEEMKMVNETHKIWNDPNIKITATCVRVPVMRAHAESINLEFKNPITETEALSTLKTAPGVSIIDDREHNRFPMPLDATQEDNVFVGRVRKDISRGDNKGLDMFVCGDQIKKGAALNAVQIAELLL